MRLLGKADIIKIAKIIKNCFFHDEMTSVASVYKTLSFCLVFMPQCRVVYSIRAEWHYSQQGWISIILWGETWYKYLGGQNTFFSSPRGDVFKCISSYVRNKGACIISGLHKLPFPDLDNIRGIIIKEGILKCICITSTYSKCLYISSYIFLKKWNLKIGYWFLNM